LLCEKWLFAERARVEFGGKSGSGEPAGSRRFAGFIYLYLVEENLMRGLSMVISLSLFLLVVLLPGVGCNNGPSNAGGGAPNPPGGGGPSGPPTSIKGIMGKVTRGPMSLHFQIEKELKADNPDWAKIQPQASEYAQLAADLGKYDPPKGTKDSWGKLTSDYSASASALDNAAKAKDKDGAKSAHAKLANSCNTCHREHRTMGPPGGR
jgi:hypothetical protein